MLVLVYLLHSPAGVDSAPVGSPDAKNHTSNSRENSICVLDKSEMGYWDLPEGTDCVEKTWIATKLGTALGNYRWWHNYLQVMLCRVVKAGHLCGGLVNAFELAD